MPPRIPSQLLACAAFLYTSRADARGGRRTGATGVFVCVAFEGHEPFETRGLDDPDARIEVDNLYVVTNAHVLGQRESLFLRLQKAFPSAGYDLVEIPKAQWIRHPDGDDLIVAPLDIDDGIHDTCAIPLDWFVGREQLSYYGAGDECFFIGRQLFLDGRERNTPCVRFGNIAMMDPEPIYQAKRNHRQESIVIEARSLGGFSGSPVFVYRSSVIFDSRAEPPGKMLPEGLGSYYATSSIIASPLAVIGIDWGHFNAHNAVVSPGTDMTVEEQQEAFNAGMMLVVPAWKVHSLLMAEGLVQMRNERQKARKEAADDESAPVMDSAGSDDADRLSLAPLSGEDALRALLKTPPHGQQDHS